ncbi:MAG: GLUG motif-containing protein, partial [Candidatus Ornithomonoglobus sp.]
NCYNTGEVSGTENYIGGVCGKNYGTIENCYYLDTCAAENTTFTCLEGEIKTIAQFQSGEVAYLLSQGCTIGETTYDGSVWIQPADEDYPVLSKIGLKQPEISDSVYQIGTAEELYWFAALVNGDDKRVIEEAGTQNTSANAVLTADITVNTGVLKSDGTLADDTSGFRSWTSIGWYDYDTDDDYSYTGTFDGQGFTVSGLYFNDPDAYDVGLFGDNYGTIKNVGVVDSYFFGGGYVGGVCGYNYQGNIIDCYNTGTVSGTDACAGGVCGYNDYESTITNCYNSGEVSGVYEVGGVCGMNENATITNCYNSGEVSGLDFVGGVCGYNDYESTITNCYYDSDKYSGNAVGDNSGTVTDVEGKTTAQFGSGEVAYLLKGSTSEGALVWGQMIVGDDLPVLTSDTAKTVYKVTFATEDNTEYAIKYANPSGIGIYEMPVNPTANAGYAFYKWSKTNEADGEAFTAGTAVTGDMTVYAVMAFSNANATGTKQEYHNTDKGDFADSYYAEIDSNRYIIPTGLKWTVTNNESVSKDLTFTAPQVSGGGTVRFGFIITGTEEELNKVQKVELNAQ